MRPYIDIPIWETKRRLAALELFYAYVNEYYSNSRAEWMVQGRIEEPRAKEARSKINLSLQKARRIIAASGVGTMIPYTPPPAVGGYEQNLDVVHNLFSIGQFQIAPDMVTGMIERSIGVYRDDIASAWRRTRNPLWWIGKFLSWFASLPLLVLSKAGFDAGKAQQSLAGKLVAVLFYLIPIVASTLTILDLLDLLGPIKNWFRDGA